MKYYFLLRLFCPTHH